MVKGMVYNVTPYMDYHPGGEDELMKAAGRDGTELFDQVGMRRSVLLERVQSPQAVVHAGRRFNAL